MELHDLLEVAVRAAKEAGKIQREWLSKEKRVEFKGEINLVTDVDRRCESKIVEIIRENFPDHNVLTEETSMPELPCPYRWIVDPVDGTTNYAHGYPHFCTSVALELHGEIVLGVVYDPIREELFTALREGGAFLNGERIFVSSTGRLIEALISTGFPYDLRENPANNLNHFNNLIMEVRSIRRDGSAALNLCYVAMGRFDGFWQLKLFPWDIAAGKILVEEGGGLVTDFKRRPLNLYGPEILATNKRIHQEMMKVLQKGA